MIAHPPGDLRAAVDRAGRSPGELDRHPEGVAALMEDHLRSEDHQLLTVLETLDLSPEPRQVPGPI